jgi:hypothetical protein
MKSRFIGHELSMAKKADGSTGSKKVTTTTSNASSKVTEEKPAVESKYIIAGVVFLLACLWDKQFMHGGIF